MCAPYSWSTREQRWVSKERPVTRTRQKPAPSAARNNDTLGVQYTVWLSRIQICFRSRSGILLKVLPFVRSIMFACFDNRDDSFFDIRVLTYESQSYYFYLSRSNLSSLLLTVWDVYNFWPVFVSAKTYSYSAGTSALSIYGNWLQFVELSIVRRHSVKVQCSYIYVSGNSLNHFRGTLLILTESWVF